MNYNQAFNIFALNDLRVALFDVGYSVFCGDRVFEVRGLHEISAELMTLFWPLSTVYQTGGTQGSPRRGSVCL